MKVTKYQLKNQTLSNGQYCIAGEWKVLKAGASLVLDSRPTSVTKNVTVVPFSSFDSDKKRK